MPEAPHPAGGPPEPDIQQLLQEPDRLTLVVQPIVDLHRAEVVGYEVLSRFRLSHPLGPDRVFRAAARQGLAAELEAMVIERGLLLAERLPENCFLSLNVDPELLTSPRVLGLVTGRTSLAGLVFELTEHSPIEHLSEVVAALSLLRERGALVAMDDAGAGYSGLKQILELEPQLLKLDHALITNLDQDPAKRALVQMIGELASRLDAWLLAEGIETDGELRVLRQLGVPLGQGYFLARPALPWPALGAEARAVLMGTPARVRSPAIAYRLLETCAMCLVGEAWPEGKLAVRLAAGRPVAMRIVDGEASAERAEHQLLRVKRESLLADVGQRAVTRSAQLCWDPLVCIDESGNFVGVIQMPRLVSALAELARESIDRQS
jgi:EAL domain-containing protein (putative c-di-GMP-specific phosphodiesterase class I)